MQIRVRFDFSVELDGRKLLTRGSWKRLARHIKSRDKSICSYCGTYAPDGHVDHKIPLARGGTDEKRNLVWSCASCNQSKGSKPLTEWLFGPGSGETERTFEPVMRETQEHYAVLHAIWDSRNLSRRNFARLFQGGKGLYSKYVGSSGHLGVWAAWGVIEQTGPRGTWVFCCDSVEEILLLDPALQAYADNCSTRVSSVEP